MLRTFSSRRAFLLPLLLAITICAGEEPSQKGKNSVHHPGRALSQKRTIEGVGNFGEVTPTLFRGAHPTRAGVKALSEMGIEIVVDAAGSRTEEKEVRQLGLQYVAIPWHCPFPSDEVFVKFLKILQENPNKKVFVNCRLGEDRTGMMVAAYRMAVQGWTADEAMQEMYQFGFTKGHHFLCPGLASYERKFPERLESNPAFRDLRSSSQRAPK